MRLILSACGVFLWWFFVTWVCEMATQKSTLTTDGLIISSAIIFAAIWIGG